MNHKNLAIVGVLLFGIIGVQSFYLYKLSNRVNRLSPVTKTDIAGNQSSTSNGPNFDSFFSMNNKSWNPFKEIQNMENQMDKMFGNMRSQMQMDPNFKKFGNSLSFSPNIDVKEKNNKIIVTADIPGSNESNINVKVENQQLSIEADTKKTSEVNNKDKNIFRSERYIGRFQRTIPLPAPVIASKMTTNYNDGVLTVTIPKAS